MVGIQGLGGIPEPKPDRTAKAKTERDNAPGTNNASGTSSQGGDAVKISSAAQAAAEVANIVQAAAGQEEVRLEKVEAARAHIAQGDYKNPEVVSQLADKLLKFL